MIRVGVVGFGFMGRMHWRCWRALEGIQVAAICDARAGVFEQDERAAGNIEGAADVVDLSGVRLYQDFEQMLTEQKLDAISLTLPTYLHADYSINALKAGLNVLCEKPMALDVGQCNRMIEAATSSNRVLQIGHCLRFWPEYMKAKEIVAAGEYGRVVSATFQRLGSAPSWAWDGWATDEQRSGGMALDLHIHDTDFVQHVFGMPNAVRSFGGNSAQGQLVHIVTEYFYEDGKVVTAEGSWAMMPSFGFEMSFNILLDKATLVYDCTRQPTLRICPDQGEAFEPELPEDDAYLLEIDHFAKVIRGEQTEEVITLEQSRDSVIIIEAEKESAATGRTVSLT
ncbi:MAG: Gfo/Idh/MocA family protein [Planctomycetota bacterium]